MVNKKAQRLVTKAEMSRLAGVSRAGVTKACRNSLLPALVGKLIDIDHELSIAYIKKGATQRPYKPLYKKKAAEAGKTQKPASKAKPKKTKKQDPKPKEDGEPSHYTKDDAIAKYLDWTLRELVDNFGTDEQFCRWLSARKTIEDIRLKEVQTDEKLNSVISRDLVRTHLFGAIENININLLTDASGTIAERGHSLVKTGGTVGDLEKLIKVIMSKQLKGLKSTAQRALK